jgi:MFS family permease
MSTTHLTRTPHPAAVADRPAQRPGLGRQAGFRAVALSLAALTAFSTAPSPLYGLYKRQDHLTSVTITVVYAVYAVGLVASLILVGHLSDSYGRRRLLIPALLTALVAALIFSFSTSLPALLVGRVVTGVALGAAIATGTAWLTDLGSEPGGGPSRRSQVAGIAANVGGLATGPLFAGLVGQFLPGEPRLPYIVFALLLAAAVVATAASPEGRPVSRLRPAYRPQRLTAPAGARAQFNSALTGVFLCFTVFGLLAGLAGAFLAGPLHRPSPALAGLTVFISFGIGALTQISTISWAPRRLLATGIPILITGLLAIVAAAWVKPPSLALFLAATTLVGIGSGAMYRVAFSTVLATAAPSDRAGALASFFVVGYVGLSLPVVGAGIALQHVSFQVVLLAASIAVASGTLLAAPQLARLERS